MEYTREELERYFDESTEPIRLVVNEHGENIENAEVRKTEIGYIYTDDVNGWELITESEYRRLDKAVWYKKTT